MKILCSILSALSLFTVTFADDAAAFKTALEKPVLAPGQVLKELQAFIEPRFIKPPKATDRAAWEKEASRVRRDMLEQIVFRGEATQWRDAKCGVVWLDTIDGGPGYRIRKFRYEALPGMWIPGLLYLPEKLAGNVPVAINVNGHAADGKATDYKQLRAINLAKRGMLSLNLEWFGMGQLRTPGFAHGRMNQLDLCGASGLAPFYLALLAGRRPGRVAGTCGQNPRAGDGALGRRLADHSHQLARRTRDAGQSRGRLWQLLHEPGVWRHGRFGAGSGRHGDGGRLLASDGVASTAPYVADLQRVR